MLNIQSYEYLSSLFSYRLAVNGLTDVDCWNKKLMYGMYALNAAGQPMDL